MSSTPSDDALSWLLSISATCTSSPIGFSSPADYSSDFAASDWLQMSPTSTPLQDVTTSSRVNHPQESLNYRYDVLNACGSSQTSFSNDSVSLMALPSSVLPGAFNCHNRMESETSTLLNTPSPRPLSLYSSVGTPNHPQIFDTSRHHQDSPQLFASPSSRLFQDLQKSPFGSYYNEAFFASRFAGSAEDDFSPVVRADDLKKPIPVAKTNPQPRKKKQPRKKTRKPRPLAPSAFVQRLESTPLPLFGVSSIPANSSSIYNGSQLADMPLLRSPVRLLPATATSTIANNYLAPLPALFSAASPPAPLDFPGLSPLTPLESSPQAGISTPIKLTIKLKRQQTNPSTPPRRSKRRRTAPSSDVQPTEDSPEVAHVGNPQQNQPRSGASSATALQPTYSNRTLPFGIPISENFPLFYRRFPASSWYQETDSESPCSLFDVAHPSGSYNPPRSLLDLYTPRFVKGKGVEKVGLCPICVEPLERGGESKKIWLAMKFSAFKCYHMQYAHGISASTGKPFSPPVAFQVILRQNPGKNEKSEIQQGQCHKCSKWVAVEGIKDMESKVPELHWWKHAAACHQDSWIDGEADYFEQDTIYTTLVALEESSSA